MFPLSDSNDESFSEALERTVGLEVKRAAKDGQVAVVKLLLADSRIRVGDLKEALKGAVSREFRGDANVAVFRVLLLDSRIRASDLKEAVENCLRFFSHDPWIHFVIAHLLAHPSFDKNSIRELRQSIPEPNRISLIDRHYGKISHKVLEQNRALELQIVKRYVGEEFKSPKTHEVLALTDGLRGHLLNPKETEQQVLEALTHDVEAVRIALLTEPSENFAPILNNSYMHRAIFQLTLLEITIFTMLQELIVAGVEIEPFFVLSFLFRDLVQYVLHPSRTPEEEASYQALIQAGFEKTSAEGFGVYIQGRERLRRGFDDRL